MEPEARAGSGRLPSDEELVARLRDRDEAAFALLVDTWSGGMGRLARSFVATRESADEVVQDTWLAVIRGLDGFEGRSSLKTWVYRILVNTARRRGSREGRTVPMSSLLPTDEDHGPSVDPARFLEAGHRWAGHWREFPAAWPSPEQTALSGEVHSQVADAVAELPDRQRIVITLRDVEGYTSQEVREILDISVANQRVLLHRARAYVRGRLETYFATVDAEHIGGEVVP
jgi:RNA polymerase sigma-70 factor, ECF subfamily